MDKICNIFTKRELFTLVDSVLLFKNILEKGGDDQLIVLDSKSSSEKLEDVKNIIQKVGLINK